MTDETALRLQLAACAMAALLRRREINDAGDVGPHQYDPTTSTGREIIASDALLMADALLKEAGVRQ